MASFVNECVRNMDEVVLRFEASDQILHVARHEANFLLGAVYSIL